MDAIHGAEGVTDRQGWTGAMGKHRAWIRFLGQKELLTSQVGLEQGAKIRRGCDFRTGARMRFMGKKE